MRLYFKFLIDNDEINVFLNKNGHVSLLSEFLFEFENTIELAC